MRGADNGLYITKTDLLWRNTSELLGSLFCYVFFKKF